MEKQCSLDEVLFVNFNFLTKILFIIITKQIIAKYMTLFKYIYFVYYLLHIQVIIANLVTLYYILSCKVTALE